MLQNSSFIEVEDEKDVDYWLRVFFFSRGSGNEVSGRSNERAKLHICFFVLPNIVARCCVCDS